MGAFMKTLDSVSLLMSSSHDFEMQRVSRTILIVVFSSWRCLIYTDFASTLPIVVIVNWLQVEMELL